MHLFAAKMVFSSALNRGPVVCLTVVLSFYFPTREERTAGDTQMLGARTRAH
jgi:hypothetical protein